METNPNIIRLLEMLDHPEQYSEQEIRDIIDSDGETREAYRLMVMAKQSYRHEKTAKAEDLDAAWNRFERKAIREEDKEQSHLNPSAEFGTDVAHSRNSSFSKIAASFIGLLFASGIAFAAIHIVQRYQKQNAQIEQTGAEQPSSAKDSNGIIPADTLTTDTVSVQPKVYDNIPLEEMLAEIAAQYRVEVKYQNEETRQLRFHFVWNRQQGIEQVASDLNHFERIHVTLKDNQLIVE
ncbi:MAG: DUF4974 domain-containing protein [Prevotella sp.]|nr:DUF4974 domain-containing protein [Prevotella sp.]